MRPINEIAQDIDDYVTHSSRLGMTCKHLTLFIPSSPLLKETEAIFLSNQDEAFFPANANFRYG